MTAVPIPVSRPQTTKRLRRLFVVLMLLGLLTFVAAMARAKADCRPEYLSIGGGKGTLLIGNGQALLTGRTVCQLGSYRLAVPSWVAAVLGYWH